MLKNKSKIIISLLLIIATLLLIDIITGIWFMNRENLSFDSSIFNNILTPIISLFAVIIYGYALNNSLVQNKILLSNNLKPHYETEIETLIVESKRLTDSKHKDLFEGDVTFDNFIDRVMDSIVILTKSDDFHYDHEDFERGIGKKRDYFLNRSYVNHLWFISQYTMGFHPFSFFYDKVKSLIIEVMESDLIIEDKQLIIKRIYSLFINKYLSFIETHVDRGFIPKVPILFDSKNLNANIEFKTLSNTDFSNKYDWFKNKIRELNNLEQ